MLTSYEREEEYQREQGLLAVNNYFMKLVEENDVDLSIVSAYYEPSLKRFIDYVEVETAFICYNLLTCRFEMNECYIWAMEDYNTGLRRFNQQNNL